jgi:hypothetical protein
MPRNRDEALTEYQQEIEAVLSCVAAVTVYSYPVTATEYMLVCEDQSGSTSLRLARGREMMPLDVSQRIQIFDGDNFRISTVKYFYVLWTPRPNERLIDWHYHRRNNHSFEAHLHIRDDMRGRATGHTLIDLHVPTGRVPLEDVIRFAVQEQNVIARKADGKDILDQTEATFRTKKTW